MNLDFKQGIVVYPIDGTLQAFLQPSVGSVSFSAANGRTDITVSNGIDDYLLTESTSIVNAWQGLPASTDCWIYWDINLRSAVRTHGFTTIQPVTSSSQPLLPVQNLHWFSTNDNKMYVYDNGTFRHVLRVFAAKVNNATVSPLGTGFVGRPFAGTQVGVQGSSYVSGRIIVDDTGTPIRKVDGRFFTSESQFFVDGSPANSIKLEANIVTATAVEPMAKFYVVKLSDFGKITLARYDDIGTSAIAMLMEDLNTNETGTICVQGLVTNPSWNWTTPGAQLWVTGTGLLTETDPHVADSFSFPTGRVPVGRVFTQTSVLFDQGLGAKGDRGPGGGGAGPIALNDLTDVTITSPAANDSLIFNGIEWINNSTPPAAQLWKLENVAYGTNASGSVRLSLSRAFNGVPTSEFATTTDMLNRVLSGFPPIQYTFPIEFDGVVITPSQTLLGSSISTIGTVVSYIATAYSSLLTVTPIASEEFTGIQLSLLPDSAYSSIQVVPDSELNPLFSAILGDNNVICRPIPSIPADPIVVNNNLTPSLVVPEIDQIRISDKLLVDPASETLESLFWTAATKAATNIGIGRILTHGGISVGTPSSSLTGYHQRASGVYSVGTLLRRSGEDTISSVYVDRRWLMGGTSAFSGDQNIQYGSRLVLNSTDGKILVGQNIAVGGGSFDVYVSFTAVGSIDNGDDDQRLSVVSLDAKLSNSVKWTFNISSPQTTVDDTAFSLLGNTNPTIASHPTNGAVYLSFPTIVLSDYYTSDSYSGISWVKLSSSGSVLWQYISCPHLVNVVGVFTDVNYTSEHAFSAISYESYYNKSTVVAINGNTGSPIWERDFIGDDSGYSVSGPSDIRFTDISVDQITNTIYVVGTCVELNYRPSPVTFVMALNSTNGAQLWIRLIEVNCTNESQPKVTSDSDGVYVACEHRRYNNTRIVLNRLSKTGNLIWQREISKQPTTDHTFALKFGRVPPASPQSIGKLVNSGQNLLMSLNVGVYNFHPFPSFDDAAVPNIVTVSIAKISPPVGINQDFYQIDVPTDVEIIEYNQTVDSTVSTAYAMNRRNPWITTQTPVVTLDNVTPYTEPYINKDIVFPLPWGKNVKDSPNISFPTTTKVGQLALGGLLPPPTSLVGSIEDHKGMIRCDSQYIYYCFSEYDGFSKIWKKSPFDSSFPITHRELTIPDLPSNNLYEDVNGMIVVVTGSADVTTFSIAPPSRVNGWSCTIKNMAAHSYQLTTPQFNGFATPGTIFPNNSLVIPPYQTVTLHSDGYLLYSSGLPPNSASAGAERLNELLDVGLTNAVTRDDVLTFDGTVWLNSPRYTPWTRVVNPLNPFVISNATTQNLTVYSSSSHQVMLDNPAPEAIVKYNWQQPPSGGVVVTFVSNTDVILWKNGTIPIWRTTPNAVNIATFTFDPYVGWLAEGSSYF